MADSFALSSLFQHIKFLSSSLHDSFLKSLVRGSRFPCKDTPTTMGFDKTESSVFIPRARFQITTSKTPNMIPTNHPPFPSQQTISSPLYYSLFHPSSIPSTSKAFFSPSTPQASSTNSPPSSSHATPHPSESPPAPRRDDIRMIISSFQPPNPRITPHITKEIRQRTGPVSKRKQSQISISSFHGGADWKNQLSSGGNYSHPSRMRGRQDGQGGFV